ncbi:hypothetical protein ACXZ1K_01435 [Pedobacter sp. PWIIR3]
MQQFSIFVKKNKLTLFRFAIYYLIFTLVLGIVAFALQGFYSDVKILADKFWLIFGFLAGLTFIAYAVADLGIKRNPETGIMAIMGSIAVKMLFSMAFVLIYSLKSKERGLVFVLDFFSLYLLFSFFEIYCLLRNLRHQNK